ncbi:Receptor-type tyrosine-protein phosphatase epsilon [Holothuria leucospilota]|uniref:protein-tyrosine-phosphatase n=1 Tax=Holothuria leucospilota TaxID=206669 RepID=A0A9Q1HBU2_HOLLE|nr:Receptor-type tyrosine-protein phosphatase epsilon [Holothuria leucospilota]
MASEKKQETDAFMLLFALILRSCQMMCEAQHAQQDMIYFNQATSVVTIDESHMYFKHVCLNSLTTFQDAVYFYLTAFPTTSDLEFPTDLRLTSRCVNVAVRVKNNDVREDTKTFLIFLRTTSSIVGVDESRGQCTLHVIDDDYDSNADSCPTPTVINGHEVSCSNNYAPGSVCNYRCNDGFERLSGDSSRTCNTHLRWSGLPLFCIPNINECNSNHHNCSRDASCHDYDGGFSCICNTGYSGDGVTCEELPSLNAAPILEDASNTSITVIWRAWDPDMDDDDGEPPILAYIPYYRMDASDEWISGPRILTNETLQFKADNLEVDTLYEFSVAVVREGENGEGRRSPSVKVKTLCNVPDVASSVNVQLTSSSKVNVSWQLPPGEVMCSTGVTSYKVYYRIEGSIDDTPQLAGTVEDVDTRWFIVDDGVLQPESSYIFFVTVTTDQESGFNESQTIQILDASGAVSPVFLIILVVILVTAVTVVFIVVRCRRKNNLKNKETTTAGYSMRYGRKSNSKDITTNADDGYDVEYANAAMADDPGGYIPLELQSKTVSSSHYQDLKHTRQGSLLTSPQYEVSIVPEPQKPEATPKYQTRNMKGVNSGAYEDVRAGSDKRQLPDVPQLHPSGDEDGEDKSYEVPDRLEEYTGVYINIKNKPKIVQSGPIKVAEFRNFMTRNKEDVVSDIVQQFMALPSGEQHPWSVALKFQNKPKNFHKTVLPYDHSRVKLDTNDSDARSDYINASYIKNHHREPSFIAAQGPQEGTMDDFWEMVWQENVETIVMVTDINEGDKLLCSTYWPSHMGEAYGAITVILMESTNFMSHTMRELNLLKGKQKAEVHTVTQIQVHSWPYGSVPKEPASLISIIKKVKSLQTDGSSSPLLVHCSNGVGATGTFIAAYVLMDVIKKNKEISVFEFVKRMRDDRVDMVQTRVQYLFIFEFLLAVLQSTDSEMSCDQLKKDGYNGLKLKSQKEFKVLQECLVKEQHYENYVGNSPENQHKNRFNNIIPGDNNRPVLKSEGNTFGSSNYINAFHVMDFGGREFIMTQTPLSSTVEDFWRLVYDYECTTIVMLNTVDGSDKTVVQYWPEGAHGSARYGLMTVECTSTTKSDSCVHSQFQMSHKKVKKKSVSVDHFAFCGWSGNQPDVSKLMEFIRCTGSKDQGPLLVHCINGVGLSAVYIIVKTERKRLERDGFVDVFQSLKKLRKNCPLAIQTQEEYTLCYKLLKDHLDNPEEYAVVY